MVCAEAHRFLCCVLGLTAQASHGTLLDELSRQIGGSAPDTPARVAYWNGLVEAIDEEVIHAHDEVHEQGELMVLYYEVMPRAHDAGYVSLAGRIMRSPPEEHGNC